MASRSVRECCRIRDRMLSRGSVCACVWWWHEVSACVGVGRGREAKACVAKAVVRPGGPARRTARRCSRSDLLPISMIVMLELECCLASSSHEVRWLKVSRLRVRERATATMTRAQDHAERAGALTG